MSREPAVQRLPRRSQFDTVVENTGAGVGGEVADLGLRTLGSLLMARILGPAGLGSWLVARTVAFDLSGILARCGLDEAALRFVARSRGRPRTCMCPWCGEPGVAVDSGHSRDCGCANPHGSVLHWWSSVRETRRRLPHARFGSVPPVVGTSHGVLGSGPGAGSRGHPSRRTEGCLPRRAGAVLALALAAGWE